MNRRIGRLNHRMLALAALGLAMLPRPEVANPAPAMAAPTLAPSYWIAHLKVSGDYKKDDIREYLNDFHRDLFTRTQRHSVWGKMDNERECYDEQDHKVPNCEVVQIDWDRATRRLSVYIRESDERMASIAQYTCTMKDTFEMCLDNHRPVLVGKVEWHDTHCHRQGKCDIKGNEFVPSN
jgi:hypothetical protein